VDVHNQQPSSAIIWALEVQKNLKGPIFTIAGRRPHRIIFKALQKAASPAKCCGCTDRDLCFPAIASWKFLQIAIS